MLFSLTTFTPGDLVVFRTGDNSFPDSATVTSQVPIYLDEYTPSGTLVGSVAVPATGADAITVPGAGDDQHQGVLSLSTDNNWLSFAGYDAAEGSSDGNAQIGTSQYQAEVGEISGLTSTLNTSTPVDSYGADGDFSSTGSANPYVRGAYTNDGKEFWTFGKYASSGATSDGGLAYVSGTGPGATTTTVEGFADWRDITALNGQLYGGTGSSSVGNHGPYQVSTGEPTTNLGNSLSNNTDISSYVQSASALTFVDIPTTDASAGTYNGQDVMYTVGDQGVAGIAKYYWTGTTWAVDGSEVSLNANDISNPTGLVAVPDPTNPSWVDITVSGTNGVYSYVDKSGDPLTAIPANSFTETISAPSNEQFRGVALAPDNAISTLTPGDVVVLRGGNYAYPDLATSTNEVPVSLDEYTQSGSYVGTVSVDATGDANTLTVPGVGSFQHEGLLEDSGDGNSLSFAGYNALPSNNTNSTANIQATVGKRAGDVGTSTASLNTSTVVNSYGSGSSNPYIRGAYTNDGNEFWTFGKYASSGATSNGGLAYVSGTGASATTTTVEGFGDWRDIIGANGQLYGGTGSSSIGNHGPYAVDNTNAGLSADAATEPTTNLGNSLSLNTQLGNYPGGQSASALALVNEPGDPNSQNGENVLYTVGDQSTPGIVKYYWNGSAWVNQTDVALNATNIVNPTGLIAVEDPSNPNWVDITVSGTNGVYSYVDKTGYNGAIPANAFALIATPLADQQFYGAAIAPQSVPVVTTEPAGGTVASGSTATFTAATSTSSASVQWYELAPGGTAFTPDTTDAGNTTTTLSVIATSANAGYKYEAVFSSASASATTESATLTLDTPPTVLTNPSNAVVAIGGTATFTATASGTPTPTVQWYEEAPGQTTFTADTTDAGNTTGSLQVVSSQANAGYEYEAVFSNGIGSPATSSPATLTNLATFTPGDLVVLRGGSAAFPDTPTSTNEVPVSLDEYTPAGVYVGTVNVDASGDANTLTIPGVGEFQHEGVLSDSTNGDLISFAGYNAAPSNAALSSANLTASVGKRVGDVGNAASSLNTSTVVNSYGTGSSGPYIRGAVTNDGTSFCTFGKYPSSGATSNGGLAYVSGTGATATTTTIEGFADWRDIVIANGQLYGGTGSSSVGNHGPYQISTGEPTTNLGNSLSNNTQLGNYPGGQSASALALLDVLGDSNTQNGLDVVYTIGDQSTPGIVKYYYNGTAWVTANLDVALNATTNVVNPTGLIAVTDPTNPKWVDITVSGTNGIYTYVDKAGPSGAIPANAFTDLVSSPTNEQFYGIALAPAANKPSWLSLNSQASWNSTSHTLAVSGPTLITADPGSDEPNIVASGASAAITIDPALSPANGNSQVATDFHIGGVDLSNGADLVVTQIDAPSSTDTSNGSYSADDHASDHDVLVIGSTSATSVPVISILGTSKLDLADNDLIIHTGSASYSAAQALFSSVQALGQQGRNAPDHAGPDGPWTGNGLTSSTAQTTYANDGEEVTALAVAFNADYGAEGLGPDGTGFISWPVGSNSETVGANDIIVKYTYFGDADLEGKVYADASAAVNANFTGSSSLVSQGYPNDDWAFGDFDGSGAVNANDAAAVNAFYGFGETGSDSGFPEL